MIKETIIICQFEDVKVLESFEILNNKYSRQGLVMNERYVRIPTISFKPDYPSKYTTVTYNAIKCGETVDPFSVSEDGYFYAFVPEEAEVKIIKTGKREEENEE